MMVRPGEGIINWNSIVEAKRRKKREQKEQENEGKPNPYRLDKQYNCVRHVVDKFIDPESEMTEDMNITIYRKMLICPLRSQIKQVKARMFNGSDK